MTKTTVMLVSSSPDAPDAEAYLAALHVCLLAMLARPSTFDLARVMLQLFEERKLQLLEFTDVRPPSFAIFVSDQSEIAPLLSEVQNDLDVAILELCAKRDLCFRPGVFAGRPDLQFGILRRPCKNGRLPQSRKE